MRQAVGNLLFRKIKNHYTEKEDQSSGFVTGSEDGPVSRPAPPTHNGVSAQYVGSVISSSSCQDSLLGSTISDCMVKRSSVYPFSVDTPTQSSMSEQIANAEVASVMKNCDSVIGVIPHASGELENYVEKLCDLEPIFAELSTPGLWDLLSFPANARIMKTPLLTISEHPASASLVSYRVEMPDNFSEPPRKVSKTSSQCSKVSHPHLVSTTTRCLTERTVEIGQEWTIEKVSQSAEVAAMLQALLTRQGARAEVKQPQQQEDVKSSKWNCYATYPRTASQSTATAAVGPMQSSMEAHRIELAILRISEKISEGQSGALTKTQREAREKMLRARLAEMILSIGPEHDTDYDYSRALKEPILILKDKLHTLQESIDSALVEDQGGTDDQNFMIAPSQAGTDLAMGDNQTKHTREQAPGGIVSTAVGQSVIGDPELKRRSRELSARMTPLISLVQSKLESLERTAAASTEEKTSGRSTPFNERQTVHDILIGINEELNGVHKLCRHNTHIESVNTVVRVLSAVCLRLDKIIDTLRSKPPSATSDAREILPDARTFEGKCMLGRFPTEAGELATLNIALVRREQKQGSDDEMFIVKEWLSPQLRCSERLEITDAMLAFNTMGRRESNTELLLATNPTDKTQIFIHSQVNVREELPIETPTEVDKKQGETSADHVDLPPAKDPSAVAILEDDSRHTVDRCPMASFPSTSAYGHRETHGPHEQEKLCHPGILDGEHKTQYETAILSSDTDSDTLVGVHDTHSQAGTSALCTSCKKTYNLRRKGKKALLKAVIYPDKCESVSATILSKPRQVKMAKVGDSSGEDSISKSLPTAACGGEKSNRVGENVTAAITTTELSISMLANPVREGAYARLEEISWGEVAMNVSINERQHVADQRGKEEEKVTMVMMRSSTSQREDARSVICNVVVNENQEGARSFTSYQLSDSLALSENGGLSNTSATDVPTYVIASGSTASITCELNESYMDNGAKVEWYKGTEQHIIVGGKYERISHDLLEVLIIREVAVDDTQLYHIKVSGELYPIAYLAVESATHGGDDEVPRFLSPPQTLFLMEGQRAIISCQMDRPHLDVAWYKGQERLEKNERLRVEASAEGHHRLIIESVDFSDQGTYYATCGELSTSITLIVEELIEEREVQVSGADTDDEELTDYLVPSASTATIACELGDTDVVQLHWLKNDKEVKIGEAEKYEHVISGRKHYLVIHDVQPTDSGVYSVRVNNVKFKVARMTISDQDQSLGFGRKRQISSNSIEHCRVK